MARRRLGTIVAMTTPESAAPEVEIAAIREVAHALEYLDGSARRRVLKWAWARFCPWQLLGPADSLDDWSEPAEEIEATEAEAR